jgi:penicillin-binding protein 1A
MAGSAGAATVIARTELPQVDPLLQSTFVCGSNVTENCTSQNAMATLQGGEDRVNVRYEDIPPVLVEAVVATEDRDFFDHRGLDPVGIGRALYRDLRGGGASQGGSTITQQYVKNAFLTSERAITRKLREAVLAVKLEQRMSKEEILEGYLNTIYFGRGAYGVAAASRAYFGKNLNEIGVAEAAYLAGLIRAPVLADATNDAEEAERRRHVSLVAMEEEGYITAEERAFADAVSFEDPNYFRPASRRRQFETQEDMRAIGGDYITHYVNQRLRREPFNLTEQEIFGGGYRVYTSIDPQMQDAAWHAVYDTLPQDPNLVGAFAAVDDQGLVRAMVGGRDFNASQVNFAAGVGTDGMQVGSTFKPIALAELVSQNKSLRSTYNAPDELEIQQDAEGCAPTWTVHNYAESEGGSLDIRAATEQSSNTAYGQMMWDLGPENVIEMAHNLGMDGDISPACGPIVLGTELSTPLEMATVYSTFANRGVRKTPALITRVEQVDQDGNVNVIWERPAQDAQGQRVLTEQQADTVTDVLQGVISNGTGTGADIGKPAAGKTGTAQANRDAWFVGYVPKLTAAVWMGRTNNDWDDPETPEREQLRPPMAGEFGVNGRDVTGGSFPAQIWAQFMRNVTDHRQWNDPFPEVPEDVLNDGDIVGTPPPTQPTTTVPPGGPPSTPPPQNTTTTTSPDSTTSSSSSVPPSSDTTGPTFTLPTTPTSETTEPGPGRGND